MLLLAVGGLALLVALLALGGSGLSRDVRGLRERLDRIEGVSRKGH